MINLHDLVFNRFRRLKSYFFLQALKHLNYQIVPMIQVGDGLNY